MQEAICTLLGDKFTLSINRHPHFHRPLQVLSKVLAKKKSVVKVASASIGKISCRILAGRKTDSSNSFIIKRTCVIIVSPMDVKFSDDSSPQKLRLSTWACCSLEVPTILLLCAACEGCLIAIYPICVYRLINNRIINKYFVLV